MVQVTARIGQSFPHLRPLCLVGAGSNLVQLPLDVVEIDLLVFCHLSSLFGSDGIDAGFFGASIEDDCRTAN
jgi:hypothetical protein